MERKAEPVRVITSADLIDNGGQYRLISKDAIKVSGAADATELIGGSPIVVYPVPASEISDYNLIQGEPIHVTEAPVSRGQDSSRWAYPVYHVGPGTWPSGLAPVPSSPTTFNFDPSLATFTAAMAKRNGPGPFAACPICQGKLDGTGTPDSVSFARGTQISGSFYPTADTNQGSIVLWVTPEWNGSDAVERYLLKIGSLFIRKTGTNLQFSPDGVLSVSASIAGWVTGVTHCVVVRWDADNTIDGTNYLSISIDDSHTFGNSSTWVVTAPDATNYIGSAVSTFPANALIEALTIYRRVLFDGTYGTDVGNGDELNLVYNAGSGRDLVRITGSWDVVLCVPTNSTIDALATGTGEAWAHPHASAVLTDTYCQTTYASSTGWTTRGAPTTGPADMTATEKIFNWGYEWTASADGDGVTQSKTGQTAGQNYVIRALAHSASNVRIRVHDDTNGADIVTFLFGSGSSKAAPGVGIFTWELPTIARNGVAANCTAMTISIEGTAAGQAVYLHQAEVQVNSVDNPGFETGSGDPWIPDGWQDIISWGAGDAVQDTVDFHSGLSSLRVDILASHLQTGQLGAVTGDFYCAGAFGKVTSDSNLQLGGAPSFSWDEQHSKSYEAFGIFTTSTWTHKAAVNRADSGVFPRVYVYVAPSGTPGRWIDDAYAFRLTAVTLTVTPASLANSTESAGIRVDGRDTFSQPITALTTSQGKLRLNYTPRHSAANMLTFGSTPYILDAYGDANDFIRVYWSAANTIRMDYSLNGTAANGTWNATGAIVAGTTYLIEVEYSGGGNMTLSVDGAVRITLAGIPAAFGTAPVTLYAGHRQDSTLQGDAVFGAP